MPKETYYKCFYNTLHLFYIRNGSKKRLISEKWDHFENYQKLPPMKDFSLCKIVTLGPKLNMRKNMLNTLLTHLTVFLYKKQLQKLDHFEYCQKWPASKGYSFFHVFAVHYHVLSNGLHTWLCSSENNILSITKYQGTAKVKCIPWDLCWICLYMFP